MRKLPDHCYYWISLFALTATLVAVQMSDRQEEVALARPLEEIPEQFDGWSTLASRPLEEEVRRVLGATAYLYRVYARDEWMLELFLAYYGHQRAGEAMHSPKNCLPGSGWEVWRHDITAVDSGKGRVRINQYRVRNGGDHRVVLYWYQTPDRIFASEFAGKAYLIWDALVTGRRSGSIVRVTLPDREGATAAGAAFSARIIPAVQSCLTGSAVLEGTGAGF